NAIELQFANKGYVSLPSGLLAKACEVTVAIWVNMNNNSSAWNRIWDFGMDTTRYMFLTPMTNTDDVARFGISIYGNGDEEDLKPKIAVPTQKWTHVAVVLGPSGGTLYFDGEVVASDETMALRPADLGSTVHNYIGRSQFSTDPYLDGAIDDFRLYDRALTLSEIKALAAGD
ncbi:MAG TPA: LamG domain-containing protein, partial [Mycobacterium sp.]|nr:LamG domain-containing protein [Mycobacterium sp.]